MNDALKNIEPAAVWEIFAEICAIPHPSFHERALADHLAEKARAAGMSIRRDEAGRAVRARIIDYKSNQVAAAGVETLVLHYTPQLRWYRMALARLLDLDPKKIRCTLIFTRPGLGCGN